jgi:hypothetical protein
VGKYLIREKAFIDDKFIDADDKNPVTIETKRLPNPKWEPLDEAGAKALDKLASRIAEQKPLSPDGALALKQIQHTVSKFRGEEVPETFDHIDDYEDGGAPEPKRALLETSVPVDETKASPSKPDDEATKSVTPAIGDVVSTKPPPIMSPVKK